MQPALWDALYQQWKSAKERVQAYRYCTPWFVVHTTWQGVTKHRLMGLAAALSFYALFALIPLIVLIFFLISHLVYSSDYAIVKLAILTSNLLPEFSQRIMVEVYNNTRTKAAWGGGWLFDFAMDDYAFGCAHALQFSPDRKPQ